MITTEKQAKKIIDIVKWIDPFSHTEFDLIESKKQLKKNTFEKNIKDLINYIKENYTITELLNDRILLKKLYQLVCKNENVIKILDILEA